ncbi:MAG: glycosyltransferase family 4 protein [Oscillochloridaceae bacterium]|nr:glycosyltransferase family 4 protein [Chloroflexaceae bacterium]MDW8389221.1 glycosyltransferase family 4 protein [Oscillochloridaceae bacterium]
MHFWLVNPFDPLPSDQGVRPMRYQMLVAELLRRGHTVTWLCSDFLHIPKVYRRTDTLNDLPRGLRAVLIHTRPYRKNVSLTRLLNHRDYVVAVRRWMARNAPPDGIIVSYPLPEAALDCLRYGRAHGVPVVVDVQDIWPDEFLSLAPQQLRWAARLALTPMFRRSRQVFTLAEHCVAVSQHYLRVVTERRGAPFAYGQVYYLGYDPSIVDGNDNEGLPDLLARGFTPETTNIVFVGTLGTSYDIDTLIEAAGVIASEAPRVRFFLAGEGPLRETWETRAQTLGLQNITFLGFLNITQLRALLTRSFAGLVAFRSNLYSIPNKPNEYMAFGLPLISSLKGELQRLIDNEPLGVSYEAQNVPSLVRALRRLIEDPDFAALCRQRVRQVFAERFSAQSVYPAYVDDLERICASRAPLEEVAQ